MADAAGGFADQPRESLGLRAVLSGARKQRIRLVEQRDCDQDGDVLAERDVQGWSVTPQLRVVHDGQIVKDERACVYELDSAREHERLVSRSPAQTGTD